MMVAVFLAFLAGSGSIGAAPPPAPAGAEERAVAHLAREVPRWAKKNRCYSCHNNGDAARALYTAVRLGRSVPAGAWPIRRPGLRIRPAGTITAGKESSATGSWLACNSPAPWPRPMRRGL